jgi:hypothetical protein
MILTGEIGSSGRETCDCDTSLTTNLIKTDLRSSPSLRGESSATDRLSHGTDQGLNINLNYI